MKEGKRQKKADQNLLMIGKQFFLKIERFKCDIQDINMTAIVPWAIKVLRTLFGYSELIKDCCLTNIQNTMV